MSSSRISLYAYAHYTKIKQTNHFITIITNFILATNDRNNYDVRVAFCFSALFIVFFRFIRVEAFAQILSVSLQITCDVDIQQFKACYTFNFNLTNEKLISAKLEQRSEGAFAFLSSS